MALFMNELGEFVTHDDDEYERRRRVYGTCANVDTSRFMARTEAPPPRPTALKPRRCEWCGQTFEPRTRNNKYCSPSCARERKNSSRRSRLTQL